MKVVLFPGVGFAENTSKYETFLNNVTECSGCETEFFKWEHYYGAPPVDLPYKEFRKWVMEVLLDFQQVVKHANDMEVPEADVYMGHSAGSILALAQYDKPCIILGSPAILIECLEERDKEGTAEKFFNESRSVLNIINKYDVLAYPIDRPNIENWEMSGGWFAPRTYSPLSAHNGYWDNKKVVKKVANKLKEFKGCLNQK